MSVAKKHHLFVNRFSFTFSYFLIRIRDISICFSYPLFALFTLIYCQNTNADVMQYKLACSNFILFMYNWKYVTVVSHLNSVLCNAIVSLFLLLQFETHLYNCTTNMLVTEYKTNFWCFWIPVHKISDDEVNQKMFCKNILCEILLQTDVLTE